MPQNLPSLDALRTFLIASESQILKTAAARLGMTPSAVSQSIRRLEEELGTPLLDRDVRPLRLTAAGRALVREARPIVEAAQSLAPRIAADSKHLVLRLGLGETANATISPWLMASLLSRVTRLETRSDFTKPLATALRSGDLDVLVSPEGLLGENRWVRERLYEEDFLLVLTVEEEPPQTVDAFRALARRRPFVDYGPGSSDDIEMDRILRSMNINPLKRVGVSSSHALVGLVAELGGWSIVPATNLWCGRTFLRRVRFAPLPEGRRLVRTMWASGDALSAAELVRLTADAAREAFVKRLVPEMAKASYDLMKFVRTG